MLVALHATATSLQKMAITPQFNRVMSFVNCAQRIYVLKKGCVPTRSQQMMTWIRWILWTHLLMKVLFRRDGEL